MPLSSSKTNISSDKTTTPEAGSKKTLTPQRKHRKLLKDGSGSEVWPESIEKIFVEGLRQYWESPWATYSRGRSRWRNQFLVEYLQKAGIIRSKKQVASHIQVLRNMWKGEPEFHLVAGGEELFLETGLLAPVKLEEQCDTTALIPLDYEEIDTPSSTSTSPNFSPSEFQSEFPPSPGQPLSPMSPADSYSPGGTLIPFPTEPLRTRSSSPVVRDRGFSTSPLTPSSLAYPFDFQPVQQPSSLSHSPLRNPFEFGLNSYPAGTPTSSVPPNPTFQTPSKSESPSMHPAVFSSNIQSGSNLLPHVRSPPNRITGVCLRADGMTPFTVKIDALIPPAHPPARTSPIALKMKLCISSVDDIRSPSTLHGFAGSVSVASVWTSSAKCVTKVFVGNACISEEVDSLQLSNVDEGAISAFLPDSSLSRCRWFDASIQTNLTQEISIDNETLVYIIYDVDRRNGAVLPSAELLGYQKYRPADKMCISYPPTSTVSPSFSYASTMNYALTPFPQYVPYARRTNQTSLSCALTPVNILRPPLMATSMFV